MGRTWLPALPPPPECDHAAMTSWVRKGFDLLMAAHPDADLLAVKPTMVWLCVDLLAANGPKMEFAIWRETGCVYHVDADGAVDDDPFLVPEGSPYELRSQEGASQG